MSKSASGRKQTFRTSSKRTCSRSKVRGYFSRPITQRTSNSEPQMAMKSASCMSQRAWRRR